ncbi:hypothetical protein JOD45_000426 [Scopulibacillus daqui]|uniref:DUF433 domain-containing protein n=1 Tax=Scopulibacillus daqui TaxID=1469162 RepID=A0ABS2PVY9_9BACL|nr:hypothetical protein [Scopulibacillus daqui]
MELKEVYPGISVEKIMVYCIKVSFLDGTLI